MKRIESPGADFLVAIVVAARHAGNRQLERRAKRKLLEHYGIKLSFVGNRRFTRKGGNHAKRAS